MTIASYPITNIEQGIVKPIVVQVLEKLKQDVFYDRESPIVLIDHTGSAFEVGSTLSNANQNDLVLESADKIIAISSEKPTNDIFMASIVDSNAADVIWYDKALGVVMRPTRHRTEMNIQLTYKADTRQAVNNWVHSYYNRLTRGIAFTNINVAYELTIPDQCIAILQEVWKKREAKHGYGTGFLDYLRENCIGETAFKSNAVNKGASWVMLEQLTGLKVAVTNELPEPNRLEGGNYEATIEVNFYFDKPTTTRIKYPVFVHGQYLDAKFIDMKLDRTNDTQVYKKATTDLFSNLMTLYQKSPNTILSANGIVIPAFDDTVLINNGASLAPVLQVQLSIAEEDPRLILDLTTLATDTGLELHPELVQYLLSLKEEAFIYGAGGVLISIYRDGIRLNPDKYYLDEVGQIKSTYDMDPRGNYHFSIMVPTILDNLGESVIKHLAEYGDLAISIIKFLHPKLENIVYPETVTDETIPGVDSTAIGTTTLYNVIKELPKIKNVPTNSLYAVNTIIITK